MRKILTVSAFLLLLLCGCQKETVTPNWAAAEKQASAPSTDASGWQEKYDLGVRYLNDGNYEEAVLAFTAAIEIDPKNPDGYERRANAYWNLAESGMTQDYQLAAEDFEAAMQYGEETDTLRRRAADAYYGAGDYEKAEPYYNALLETDDSILECLINCYLELGKEQEATTLLQQRYTESGDTKYLQMLCGIWPQEVLQGYGEILGANGTNGFVIIDLDADGVPELICGEIDTKGMSEQLALTDYTLYTWQDGQAVELYHGWVDTWINPDICITTSGAIVNAGHGTSAGYCLQYVRWDGVQIEQHDFWSYAKTADVSGERVNFIDDDEVSQSYFDESLAACTEGMRVLTFLPSTRENIEGILHAQNIKALPTREQVEDQIYINVWWLNQCTQEMFGVTLGDGGVSNYGPAMVSFFPITNYADADELRRDAGNYITQDFLYRLDENVTTFNGEFCLVRGARGYGVVSYDPESIYVVSYDETSCVAQCARYQFDVYESVAELHLTYQGDHWLLTQVLIHGSTDTAFDYPYWD